MAYGLFLGACNGGLLSVSDPTLIQDSDIANTAGANAQRFRVLTAFNESLTSGGSNDGVAPSEALFTDEWMFDQAFVSATNRVRIFDVRDTAAYQAQYPYDDPHLGPLTSILTAASIALPAVRAYADTTVRSDYIAQIYALRGFAIVQMAEDLCSGFPINDIRNGVSYYSPPYSTHAALAYAVATLDTALSYVRDSVRFQYFAQVLKGRALLDLGEYASAATVVQDVPPDFVYRTDNGAAGLYATSFPFAPRAVGNRKGGNGLPFAASHDDPRVPSVFMQMRYHRTTDTVSDSLRDQRVYLAYDAPITVASGIEARLIEAEAALQADDPTTWLTTLNDLRATAVTPALPPLVDPGDTTRVDTLFKERAFWLYLTAHRLGDMRRLIHQYARPDSTVFPWGTTAYGAPFGKATAFPFIQSVAMTYNPNITTGCQPDP